MIYYGQIQLLITITSTYSNFNFFKPPYYTTMRFTALLIEQKSRLYIVKSMVTVKRQHEPRQHEPKRCATPTVH